MTRDTTEARRESAEKAAGAGKPTLDTKGEALPKKKSLDFSKLDLAVETVDERISPSETNVFDK